MERKRILIVDDEHLSDETKEKIRRMMREISELESIGDACYNLARTMNRRQESSKSLTPALSANLQAMMTLADDALTQMNTAMSGHRREHDIRETFRIENNINQMRQRLKADNIRAVTGWSSESHQTCLDGRVVTDRGKANEHEYDYAVGTLYIDLANECEKLGDYVVNVVEARFGK